MTKKTLHNELNKCKYRNIAFIFTWTLLQSISINAVNRSYIISLSQNNVDGISLGLIPGDTLLIEAGFRERIRIMNVQGDSINKVLIKNYNGAVIISNDSLNYGISMSNCSNFILSGTGDGEFKYGIKILKTGTGASGLGISNKSTNYEISNLEIANTGFAGIFAKTDPTEDGLSNRGNFTQRETYIHDNYIHNTKGEGIYLGHSFYSGVQKTINGESITLFPHELKGVRVYNNIIDNTGWDGIQVGCATEDCEIYNNQVSYYGTNQTTSQNSGIQIGGGTTGKCYNNYISRGYGSGISIFGLGDNLIYNNVILKAGYYGSDSEASKVAYGIFCDDRSTIPGRSFNFINNTIISPRTDGIRIYSSQSKNNKFYNNLIINPGSYGLYTYINQSYIYYNTDVDFEVTNNYFSSNFKSSIELENIVDIYNYSCTLPIIDKGKDVLSFDISTDFYYKSRTMNTLFDIGAFELDENHKIVEIKNSNTLYPNPSKGNFTVTNTIKDPLNKIIIRSLDGAILYEEDLLSSITAQISINRTLKAGNYLATIFTNNSESTLKLVIQ